MTEASPFSSPPQPAITDRKVSAPPAARAPLVATPVDPPPAAPTPTWSVAQSYGSGPRQIITDQRPANGAVVAIAWVVAVFTLGHMVPWAIAATRGKVNQAAIGLINLFLGWTFVGWVVATVMAWQAHQLAGNASTTTVVVAQHLGGGGPAATAPADWYPVSTGGQRYWNGAAWTDHHAR